MSTFLLTWNPKQWVWESLAEIAEATRLGKPCKEPWSTGNRRDIRKGDRVFLIRLGMVPKGIMGSGYSLGTCKEGKHWSGEAGRKAMYIPVSFDRLLDPETDDLLDVSSIQTGPLSKIKWATQASGILIPDDAARLLEELWIARTAQIDRQIVDIISDEDVESFPEGKIAFRRHRQRERNKKVIDKAKALAIKRDGKLACTICDFDFANTYGPLGEGFIEGHHTKPLADAVGEVKTKVEDIALVCSNCHRMLHRRKDWLHADELKSLIKR